MAFGPQELVTLTNHGPMRLRSAVARAMTLPFDERKRVTVVRRQTGHPEIRADQGSCGRVGQASRAGPKRVPATFSFHPLNCACLSIVSHEPLQLADQNALL